MLTTRNVFVSGRRTSIRLEPPMWDALQEIAQRERRTVSDLATFVAQQRNHSTLTAAIRVFIMTYFRDAATSTGHLKAGHGRARGGHHRRTTSRPKHRVSSARSGCDQVPV